LEEPIRVDASNDPSGANVVTTTGKWRETVEKKSKAVQPM
jgi:hypothetical protein